MSVNSVVEPFDPTEAALRRLRFELEMGLETVRPTVEAAPASNVAVSQSALPPGPDAGPAEAERWSALEAQVRKCTQCALHSGRTNTVFGEGNRRASVVFVGEGPGGDEDRSGRPFVGRAGQLLNRILAAMGWKREAVYICNTIKCRPPGNRTPLPDEIGACKPFLDEQLALIRPRVIVALGAPAARTLTGSSEGIKAMRGRWRMYRNNGLELRVMPTFHPAYVLRVYTDQVRRQVWDDMKRVKAYLGEG